MKKTMSKNRIEIKKDKFNINLKFYFFLKYLVKVSLTDIQANELLKNIFLYKKASFDERRQALVDFVDKNIKSGSPKKEKLILTFSEIENSADLDLFVFSLKLYSIKDLLLQEAKTRDLLDVSKLEHLSPLSLEYDKITTYSPYSTRVSGALLSLLFFNKLENGEINLIFEASVDFLKNLAIDASKLKKKGVEPNQIFMLMFSESVNQSIISDSGVNYEDRIKSVLISIGIKEKDIEKNHDSNDSSTEFDFFFELNGKSYGIGAKRTLRERYKQFIKTAQMSKLDVMIEITLGTDIRENIAKSIVEHGVFLFVADEIYASKKFLQQIDGVYPSKDFNLNILKEIANKK
jgi:hypothetical protein